MFCFVKPFLLNYYIISCERGKETAEHVLLHCDNTPQRVWSRGAQFQKLASEPAAVGQIARQLIQCKRLGQFRLASRLFYSG
jgi:hypothetical protein